jgi:hypothetical protein
MRVIVFSLLLQLVCAWDAKSIVEDNVATNGNSVIHSDGPQHLSVVKQPERPSRRLQADTMTTLEGKGSSKSSSGKGSKAAKSTPTKASKSSSGKGSASSKSAGSLPAPTPTAKSAVTHTPSAAPTRGSREETVTISYVIALTSGTDFDTVVADLIEAMNSLALNTVAEAVNSVGRNLMIQLIRRGSRRRLDARVVLPTFIESAVVVGTCRDHASNTDSEKLV